MVVLILVENYYDVIHHLKIILAFACMAIAILYIGHWHR